MNNIIKTDNLSYLYNKEEILVLDSVDLNVKKGEFLCILGHNGSGKSTLAKHFNGILLPTGGTCYVSGIDTKDEEKIFDIRKNVGMVFQNPDNQIVSSIVGSPTVIGWNLLSKAASFSIYFLYSFNVVAPMT